MVFLFAWEPAVALLLFGHVEQKAAHAWVSNTCTKNRHKSRKSNALYRIIRWNRIFSFPKKFRLHRAREFQSVIQFKHSVSRQLLQLYLKPNKSDFPRLGLVVARKVAQNAVKRNKLKRVLREVFRLHRHTLGNNDYIFRLRNLPKGTKIAPAGIVKEAEILMLKAKQCDNC